MKMRRLIGLIIVFALLLECFGVVGFASSNVDNDEEVFAAMDFLKYLNVVPDYQEFNVDLEEKVTRGDFATAIYNVFSNGSAWKTNVYYYDVPETHWAYEAVGYLTDRGIVNGSGDKLFEPDEIITVEQAYKMMISALGYSYMAEGLGGFPTGYLQTARRIDLSDGIQASGELTLGNMFMLLGNFVRTEIAEATTFTKDGALYESGSGKTILSVYRSIYCIEADVLSVNGIHIGTNEAADVDEVCIGDLVFNTEINLSEWLGRKVEAFYKWDEKSDTRTVVWARPTNREKVVEVVADYDAEFDENTYTLSYYDNETEKAKTINLDRGIIVVYNGAVVRENVSAIFKKDRYSAKFIKNNSGEYYLAVVRAYKDYVISNIDAANFKVYDKQTPTDFINLNPDDYEYFNIVVSGSVPMEFKDLKVGYVLSVYESICKTVLEVEVCTGQVTGSVDTISYEQNGNWLGVGGNKYFKPTIAGGSLCRVGNNVILYLNAAGEVAYIEETSKDFFAAYLIAGQEKDTFDSKTLIKYLKETNVVEIAECSEKLKIDGSTRKTYGDILAALGNKNEFSPQFALIKLNSKGEIIRIDTVIPDIDGNENSLQLHDQVRGLRMSEQGYIGHKSPVNEGTLFFSIPTNPTDDDDYRVLSYAAMVYDKSSIDADTYRIGDRVGIVDYVVTTFDGVRAKATALPILVEDVHMALNDDGDVVPKIIGYQGKSKVSLMLTDKVSDSDIERLKEGVVIRAANTPDGQVDQINWIYEPNDPTKYTFTYTKDLSQSYLDMVCYAHDVVDNVVQVGYASGADFDFAGKTDNVPVLIYDSAARRNPISVGTVNDIISYRNSTGDYSKLVIATRFTRPTLIVVYK